MISKLIVRTVLLGVIALLSWAGWWTWSHQFQNIAQKIMLLLIEGSVLLAATSLLVETFKSFGNLSVKKRSWKGTFFAYNFYQDGQAVRTCELFAFRSIILAMMTFMTAMCVFAMWEAIKFLFNPHAVTVNWLEVGKVVLYFVVVWVSVIAFTSGYKWLCKKFANRSQIFVWITGGLYWAIAISMIFGVLAVTVINDPGLAGMPFYWAFLYTSGVVFLCLLFLGAVIGAVIGLGYGLFKLAGKAILSLSQKFPALAEVYNTICPVQTIHFVE